MITLDHFRRVLIRRKFIILFVTLAFVAAAVLYITLAKLMYASSAMLDISQQNSQSSLSDLIGASASDEQSTRMQTEEHIMESATVLLQVADDLDLIHKPEFAFLHAPPRQDMSHLSALQKADLVGTLRNGTTLSIVPGTTIVSVTFNSTNPVLARDVPNTMLDVYIGQDLGSGQMGTKRVSEWLQAQTEDLRRQVEDSARKLANFQRSHNIIGVDESQNVLVDKLRLLNEQVAASQVDRIAKETNYRVAQSGNAELMGTLGLDPQLQALRGQQVQLQAEYTALDTRYGQGYPRMHELAMQLAAVQAQIDAELQRLQTHYRQDYQAAKQNEDSLTVAMREQEKGIFSLDESAADYAILRHNAESTRNLYDQIQMKLKESGIIDTLKSTRFRVVDAAPLPTIPVSPKKAFTLTTCFFVGLLAGSILALIVDATDDKVFSGAELERVSGLPILGAVPHLLMGRLGRGTASQSSETSAELVPLDDPKNGALEAFRSLLSTVRLGFNAQSPRLQVITSTTQSEGKTLVSINYARLLAQSGAKVLLIDGDLRRGRVHSRFAIPVQPGLTNYLSDRTAAVEFRYVDPSLPTLAVIPRGPTPPNPTDLLASPRFMELLATWQESFDYVVIDSAPILPVSDTLAVAQRADVVFLVVRLGLTSNSQFTRVCERLRRLKAPVKGIILNDITKSLDEYDYYYGYEYEATGEKA